MKNPITLIENSWRKNWPEVYCGLTGGIPRFILSAKPKALGRGIPAFCYHVIGEEVFRGDLAFLKHNGYQTLSADGLLDHMEGRAEAPVNSVVLSFDDGHRTLNDVAYPLLEEFGQRAVAFICPGLHCDPGDTGADTDSGLCDWDQIKRMHESGCVDFQPHTDSHRYVPRWPRPLPLAGAVERVADQRRPEEAPLKNDLQRAKDALEQRLSKTAVHMAFPQDAGTDASIHVARELGYRGLWWGVLPGRPMNYPGDQGERIVRISGEFVRRLPGEGRIKLSRILGQRYGKRIRPA